MPGDITKNQEKTSDPDVSQILELSDTDFKISMINKFKKVDYKIKNYNLYKMKNASLELKYTITKNKNTIGDFGRIDNAKKEDL